MQVDSQPGGVVQQDLGLEVTDEYQSAGATEQPTALPGFPVQPGVSAAQPIDTYSVAAPTVQAGETDSPSLLDRFEAFVQGARDTLSQVAVRLGSQPIEAQGNGRADVTIAGGRTDQGPQSEPIETIPVGGLRQESDVVQADVTGVASRAARGPHSEPIETIPIGRS